MTEDVRGPYPVSSRLFDAESALAHAEHELAALREVRDAAVGLHLSHGSHTSMCYHAVLIHALLRSVWKNDWNIITCPACLCGVGRSTCKGVCGE